MASKLNKLLILIVLFIITIIACRYDNAKKFINEKLLSNDFPYNKIKTIYNPNFDCYNLTIIPRVLLINITNLQRRI